jgi:hypothetical protein
MSAGAGDKMDTLEERMEDMSITRNNSVRSPLEETKENLGMNVCVVLYEALYCWRLFSGMSYEVALLVFREMKDGLHFPQETQKNVREKVVIGYLNECLKFKPLADLI